ncbi:reverse transcriptase [Tanacetum coccineum]
MVNTRNASLTPLITLESLQEQLPQLQQTISTVLTNQSVVNTEIQTLKDGEGTSNGRGSQTHNTQYGRMSKIEFPKFHGEDVKGWVYRCKQFFKIDGIEEERKKYGDRTPWEMYEGEVVKRFGAIYEDPIVDLKNLKQEGSVQQYQEAFESLLNRVELNEAYAVSLVIGGLKKEVSMPIRMFKITNLIDVYAMVKMQEATNAVLKPRYNSSLLPTPKFASNSVNKPVIAPFNSTNMNEVNQNVSKTGGNRPYRLTHKELEEKGQKNQCFYCDQKYSTGHKCSRKLYSLEVVVEPWLANLGDIQCNFKNLTMKFEYNARRMVLRGTKNSTVHWMQGRNASKSGQIRQAELASMVLCVYPVSLWKMDETVSVAKEVDKVLANFEKVFEVPTELLPQRSYDHQIPLMPNTPPINVRLYRHPPNQKDAIELMVKELLESGLNKYIVKDKFPIPVIKELIDELNGSVVFSKLDLRSGYQQIRMCEDNTLFAKKNKCSCVVSQVEYLGHIISAQGVSTDPAKIEAMQKWPTLTTIKQLRGFLGLTGYYRRFIKNCAIISQPLTALLKKNAFKWNESAKMAYQQLKKAMMEAPVLALPNFS